MIWDAAIVFFIGAFVAAGWQLGMVRCWTVPISIVVATIATQTIYVDFSTWLVQQLKIEPAYAVLCGYLLLWLNIEAICEVLLGYLSRQIVYRQLITPEKWAGAAIGFAKGLTILVFASMASTMVLEIPEPPSYDPRAVWLADSLRSSRLLNLSHNSACNFKRAVGKYVISNKPPSFQPDFRSSERTRLSPEQEKQIKRLVETLRTYKGLSAGSD